MVIGGAIRGSLVYVHLLVPTSGPHHFDTYVNPNRTRIDGANEPQLPHQAHHYTSVAPQRALDRSDRQRSRRTAPLSPKNMGMGTRGGTAATRTEMAQR